MNSFLWKFGALNVGASIAIQAAGGHKPWDEKRKSTFKTASQLHMFTGVGLMMLSFRATNNISLISTGLLLAGTGIFCGVCYYRCFKDDTRFNSYMPIGGSAMILGWLLMALL
jgi:uncharacterized membrane protein YgdD (TMEM256/DUF423 family)